MGCRNEKNWCIVKKISDQQASKRLGTRCLWSTGYRQKNTTFLVKHGNEHTHAHTHIFGRDCWVVSPSVESPLRLCNCPQQSYIRTIGTWWDISFGCGHFQQCGTLETAPVTLRLAHTHWGNDSFFPCRFTSLFFHAKSLLLGTTALCKFRGHSLSYFPFLKPRHACW